ncbi:hypothetical protein [Paenibacillus sp. VT-400]|nr:hypothetical protein [Paenibacillus sp. VT-400]
MHINLNVHRPDTASEPRQPNVSNANRLRVIGRRWLITGSIGALTLI